MERQQQFDFQKNGIEVMNFETLQRTYKENEMCIRDRDDSFFGDAVRIVS